jgi:hypothetical protein
VNAAAARCVIQVLDAIGSGFGIMIAWPIAHIGNIATLAVPVNIALVVEFGSLTGSALAPRPRRRQVRR